MGDQAITVGIFPSLIGNDAAAKAAADLVNVAPDAPVLVRYIDATQGKGAFAARAVREGETVLTERPLVAMQTNKHDVVACAHCLRVLGNAHLQMEVLCGATPLDAFDTYIDGNSTTPHADSVPAATFTDTIIACVHGCGEMYCSIECQSAGYTHGHKLLCVGPLDDTSHPLYQFKVNACQTNEEFLLAAKLLACIACAFEESRDLAAAARDFAHFQSGLWWDVAVLPKKSKLTPAVLRERVATSAGLLGNALAATCGTSELFAPECFARALGMFEFNNIGIRDPSPLPKFFQEVLSLPEDERAEIADELEPMLERLGAAAWADCDDSECEDGSIGSDEENDDDNDEGDDEEEPGSEEGSLTLEQAADVDADVFPPLDGTGLFALTSTLNHSCEPNCRIEYVGRGRQPLALSVVAIRDIAADEQLSISYIDASIEDVGERAKLLENYGFTCACARCERQREN